MVATVIITISLDNVVVNQVVGTLIPIGTVLIPCTYINVARETIVPIVRLQHFTISLHLPQGIAGTVQGNDSRILIDTVALVVHPIHKIADTVLTNVLVTIHPRGKVLAGYIHNVNGIASQSIVIVIKVYAHDVFLSSSCPIIITQRRGEVNATLQNDYIYPT